MSLSFLPSPDSLPFPGDPDQAARAFERFNDSLKRADPSDQTLLAEVAGSKAGEALLTLVFSQSPFLSTCITSDLAFFATLLKGGPDQALVGVMGRLRQELVGLRDQAAFWREIRRIRRNAALLIALADIARVWPVEKVIASLSDFADAVLDCALSFLLSQAHEREELVLSNPREPLKDCGYAVIAMGKLGARELNYSSDIDLIPIYDPAKLDYRHARGVADGMVKLTRELVRLLEERTADGYVFRTDLRLRPDPGATPLAVSLNGALTYYESLGQNWERAAMIKARAAAGDKALGAAFLRELTPFVWRKHLDFWAIQDVHSIKRQINAHKGGSVVAVEGHDIKVGRGGIREIEFFAQTQQLIFGGRETPLRTPRTLEALAALAAGNRIEPETRDRLSEAYRFLRTLEHRLQMIDDKQTQKLPANQDALTNLARFMGFEALAPFREKVIETLRVVEDRYAHLFEEAPSLSGPGNLVFTGGEPEEATLESLAALGFKEGGAVFDRISAWHRGRYRATRSTRARELLTEITPAFLDALGKTANPDAALARFDSFLGGLPEGVQLFSLLYQNPKLLDLLADIMGGAPALAEHLSRNAGLLDAVLSPDFFDPLAPLETLEAELAALLTQARDYQDVLDLTRRWANDKRFQVGVQILRGIAPVDESGQQLADIAQSCIAALLPHTAEEMARLHGRLPGDGMAVVALGKLGSREMTFTSDIDLLFFYDVAEGVRESDGKKPLDPTVYYGRLAQRLVTALASATGEGKLYDVDTRLRPSGSAGMMATTLKGFSDYHASDAWTWEKMALTRARAVAGNPKFGSRIEERIDAILAEARDSAAMVQDAQDMRQRLAKEFPARSAWDVKNLPGGLLDLDFAAQTLQLCHLHRLPALRQRSTQGVYAAAGEAGLLEAKTADTLVEAARLLRRVQGYLRLTVGNRFEEESAPASVKEGLARSTGRKSFKVMKEDMARYLDAGAQAFAEIVEGPARKAARKAAAAVEKDAPDA